MKSKILTMMSALIAWGFFGCMNIAPAYAQGKKENDRQVESNTEKKENTEGSKTRRAAQRGLEPFNDWVGTWNGIGQPKRMSSKGAWTEEAEWTWKIDRESAGLQVKSRDGKLLREGVLSFDPERKNFRFTVKLADDASRVYVGDRSEEGKLVLLNTEQESKGEHRLTVHMLHADRMIVLAETKPAGQASFSRIAEVGYTRQGGSFASGADSYPKCIVTDGRGTITVEHKGKTYYVCCSGCRRAFEDNPDAAIAEAAARAEKEAKK